MTITLTDLPPITVRQTVALVDFDDGTTVQVVNPRSVGDALARATAIRDGEYGDCRCRC